MFLFFMLTRRKTTMFKSSRQLKVLELFLWFQLFPLITNVPKNTETFAAFSCFIYEFMTLNGFRLSPTLTGSHSHRFESAFFTRVFMTAVCAGALTHKVLLIKNRWLYPEHIYEKWVSDNHCNTHASPPWVTPTDPSALPSSQDKPEVCLWEQCKECG